MKLYQFLRKAALWAAIALAMFAYAVTLASQVLGQTPKKHSFFDAGDAIFVGGAIADTATSVGGQELGVFRDKHGVFAPGPNIAFKGGLYACLRLLQWKYPEHHRTMLWTKIGIGSAFIGAAIYNSKVKSK